MKILALDPSTNLLKLLSDNLGRYNYEFQGATDVEIGIRALQLGYQPEIIMVNFSFCAQPTISQLQELFSLLTYPYRAIIAIINTDDEVSRTHAASMGFHAVIAKPLSLKKVLTEIESTAGISAEQFTFSPAEKYQRREVRLPIETEVVLKIVDENSEQHFIEQTITEDVSLNGAAVLTLFEVKVGTVIDIAPANETDFSVAIVRRTVIGNDYIRRLNLEIVGKKWQDFYKELTQIHANPFALQTSDTSSSIAVSQETSEVAIKLPEISGTPQLSVQEVFSQEENNEDVALEEIEPLEAFEEMINDRYKIERELGKGGLGVVYQGVDLATGKKVALKFLIDDQTAEDPVTNQKFFEREIKILSQIQHPNIVSILDSGFSNNRPFFVMEYVEGKSLDELIRTEKIWSVPRVLNLLQQLCPALYTMHSKNIVHRDLKPGNIMIQKIGDAEKAVLLDLGIAKMVSGAKENSLMKDITKTGMIVGTLGYTSPEQCLEGEIDDGVDIYSLGIIVYQLLTGVMPFTGNTFAELILAHVQGKPLGLREINPEISNAVESVVLWAIAKNRNQRPKTIMEFLNHFESAALVTDSTDTASEPETKAPKTSKASKTFESSDEVSKPAAKSFGPTAQFFNPSSEPFELVTDSLESINNSSESTEVSPAKPPQNKEQLLESSEHIDFFFHQE